MDGKTWYPSEGQAESNYTFTRNMHGLIQGQTYIISMKAVDRAGNEKEASKLLEVTLEAVPDLVKESNVNFTYIPSEWTSSSVEVQISTTEIGYTLQYSEDGNDWYNYTESTKLVTTINGKAYYARLIDNSGQVGGIATANVSNIDTEPPKEFEAKV